MRTTITTPGLYERASYFYNQYKNVNLDDVAHMLWLKAVVSYYKMGGYLDSSHQLGSNIVMDHGKEDILLSQEQRVDFSELTSDKISYIAEVPSEDAIPFVVDAVVNDILTNVIGEYDKKFSSLRMVVKNGENVVFLHKGVVAPPYVFQLTNDNNLIEVVELYGEKVIPLLEKLEADFSKLNSWQITYLMEFCGTEAVSSLKKVGVDFGKLDSWQIDYLAKLHGEGVIADLNAQLDPSEHERVCVDLENILFEVDPVVNEEQVESSEHDVATGGSSANALPGLAPTATGVYIANVFTYTDLANQSFLGENQQDM